MNKNSSHNRRSIRLKSYDYSSEGAYFITICSHNRECIFGNIEQENMRLNEFGKIAHNEWMRTPDIRDYVVLDEFVVMPNHMHAVFMIVGAYRDTPLHPNRDMSKQKQNISKYINHNVSQHNREPITRKNNQITTSINRKSGLKSPSNTVGAIVRGYKSAVTNQINQIRKVRGVPVWQRNYFEHIIRDEESLHRIREYIWSNPQQWNEDRNNPLNHKLSSV